MYKELQQVKLLENFRVLFLQAPWKHVFMGKKTQEKEGIEENYTTTFNTLKCGSIYQCKKTF